MAQSSPWPVGDMVHVVKRTLAVLVLLASRTPAAVSQASVEVWPELDVYWQPAEHQRTMLELSMSTERDSREREAAVGLFQDYLWLPRGYARAGYRYSFSVGDDSYRESRVVGDVVVAGKLVTRTRWINRARSELRWVNGGYSYRIRDRIQVQHLLAKTRRELAPYGTFEVYYDSQYRGISRIGGRVGSDVRVNRSVVVDLYIARQNNSRTGLHNVNAFGLTTMWTLR
jgi:uncharacterized protein DUF2490